MAPAPAPSGGGSGLSKKIGGVPTWAYLAGAVVIVGGVLYLRSKNAKAAAAASAGAGSAGSAAGAGVATTPYGPAGGSGIGSDTLAAILASQGAGSTASNSSSWTQPTGQTQIGSGYGSTTPSSTPVGGQGGATFSPIAQGPQVNALLAAGTPVYYQVTPGNFVPLPPGAGEGNLQGLLGNTPLYVANPSS